MDTTTSSQGEVQAPMTEKRSIGASSAAPTTRVLAVGRLLTPLTSEQREAVMPHEVPATVKMYLDGRINQWWTRQDGKGPVFLLNVTAVTEAKALIESLPLSAAGLMECDFVELGPLRPLRLLLREGWVKDST